MFCSQPVVNSAFCPDIEENRDANLSLKCASCGLAASVNNQRQFFHLKLNLPLYVNVWKVISGRDVGPKGCQIFMSPSLSKSENTYGFTVYTGLEWIYPVDLHEYLQLWGYPIHIRESPKSIGFISALKSSKINVSSVLEPLFWWSPRLGCALPKLPAGDGWAQVERIRHIMAWSSVGLGQALERRNSAIFRWFSKGWSSLKYL